MNNTLYYDYDLNFGPLQPKLIIVIINDKKTPDASQLSPHYINPSLST